MPSYLDFDSTKKFRDFILGKTLQQPNGPQTFDNTSYPEQNLSNLANIYQGNVDSNRSTDLTIPQSKNLYKPENYFINDTLETLPRRANLSLYPYFITSQYGLTNTPTKKWSEFSLVNVITNSNYDTESELFKFASNRIQKDVNGPIFTRIAQYHPNNTLDNLNSVDITNIINGRQPFVETSFKITDNGQKIEFLDVVSNPQLPFPIIPGDYLSNPANPLNYNPQNPLQVGTLINDATGAIASMIGIQGKPKISPRPSDILIQYMGEGQKNVLFELLSFSRYAPNYTLLSTVNNLVQNQLHINLPVQIPGAVYIGDDRYTDVKYATTDFWDRQVRSNYYLSVMFDPTAANLFHRERNISEGGEIGGKLTWISAKSRNKLGANNAEFSSERSNFENGLSTNFGFRGDSILGKTQDILNSLPSNAGQARSHVANVIDQTSRVFREGDVMMSRGSAIKYTDKFTGEESGVEFCRVWTKDRSYMNYSDTMKRTGLIRKSEASVLSTPYNINVAPMSNGNGSFDGSTNIVKGKGGFYAKKYMFSIENLAWKTSNIPGFSYTDLPYCERGPNGGRVMWFPPYDLKVNETNSANWEKNVFLGRPEPVYTYQNTERNGTVTFKVIVDHPSILNLLTREHFKGMSDQEADNYINAFFAGCEDIDFYGLIRKYTTLDTTDVTRIIDYLNSGNDPGTITRWRTDIIPSKQPNTPDPPNSNGGNGADGNTDTPIGATLYFRNDFPKGSGLTSDQDFQQLYNDYTAFKPDYLTDLNSGMDTLFNATSYGPKCKNDQFLLVGTSGATKPDVATITDYRGKVVNEINLAFDTLTKTYDSYNKQLSDLKTKLSGKTIQEITIHLTATTSFVADNNYNLKLSFRRSDSIIKDIIHKLRANNYELPDWTKTSNVKDGDSKLSVSDIPPIKFKDLGYDYDGVIKFEKVNNLGELATLGGVPSGSANVDCHNKEIKTSDSLKRTAPLTFYCRETTVAIKYKSLPPKDTPKPTPPPDIVPPKINLIQETEKLKNKKPPLDELKRIVMKVLAECYYFKKLEEDSPVAFSSLKEKLRYFHPAFHSMTPEGLNARLTFLQQCIRPGDTLPIRGISDSNDINARNTTFGPPPICIMRVGDFYHSKIIIRDLNITFDDSTWDLNPEGIGVQPMLANVTMSISFIGGHGLEKPVERLQNALSSNFYANTEVYDYRATATEDKTKFTKEFLESLLKLAPKNPPQTDTNKANIVSKGQYIGTQTNMTLNYDTLVSNIFTSTSKYFDSYKTTLKGVSEKYGEKISSVYFSPVYREVKDYDVQIGTGVDTIQMLGQYKSQKDLGFYVTNLRNAMNEKIDQLNMSFVFGFDKYLNDPIIKKSEDFLKPYIKQQIPTLIEDMTSNGSIKDLEKSRNELINGLDKVNFIIETGKDGKIVDQVYSGATLSGFTYDLLYKKYKDCVTYIKDYHHKLTDGLDDSSYVMGKGSTMSDSIFAEFLAILLKDKKDEILNVFSKDTTVFNDKVMKHITKRVDKFIIKPKALEPKLHKYPTQKDTNKLSFNISDENGTFSDTQKTELTNIFSSTVNLGNKLNYYKP